MGFHSKWCVRLAFAFLVPLILAAPLSAVGRVGATAGQTYGQHSADWWQWLTSISVGHNPFDLQGAVDCSLGQQGPVWNLAGAANGVTAVRSCAVPSGKALFFPLLNVVFANEPGESLTVAEKRVLLGDFLDDEAPGFLGTRACDLFATLDGEPVLFRHPEARVQSPPFAFDSTAAPASFPLKAADPQAVSDGIWAMLPPLAPGVHTLRFGGRFCEFDSDLDHPLFPPIDVTYHLTVTGGVEPPESLSNLEVVQALYDVFAVGDGATIEALIDPDVVWIESDGIPYGGTFIGRDAVFEGVFGKIAEEWDGFTAQIFDIFEADGDRVVVLGEDSGTFKATGKSMTAPAASIWTVTDGRIVRFVQYIDTLAVVEATIP